MPSAEPPTVALAPPSTAALPRWFALFQVVLVCGIPTQIIAALVLALVAHVPLFTADSEISFQFFAMLSLIDTAMVALLIKGFLLLSDEKSEDVFVGARPIKGEILRGL